MLEACGTPLEGRALDQLWAYHGMLRAANAELNLTRIHNFEAMVLKHYVDSLIVLRHVELPSPLVDMGSGPGLPGIPLKIARPELEMVLAEPRGARAEFLRGVIAELGLKGIEVHAGKVTPRYTRPARGVITRAVATIAATLGQVSGCLVPGGRMIFMKGPDCDDEIDEARAVLTASYRLEADIAYTLPHSEHHRRLVVYERLAAEAPVARMHEGPVREISSASNPTFQDLAELLSGRGIRRQGRALVAGRKVVSEVVERFPDRVAAWVTTTRGEPPPEGLPEWAAWLRLTPELFREIDVSGTHAPLVVATVPELATYSAGAPWPPGCTLFVPFQDPENVGAALRSAAAFGVARVVLLKSAAHPFHPKALRAGGPAAFHVPLEVGPALADLTTGEVPLFALSGEGEAIESAIWPDRFGLVAGVEGPGLPAGIGAGHRVRIPIEAGVESLNAAVAVAVALYAWRTGRVGGQGGV
jgi:16S rRNA (guanine527-N7)-methyltransferase